MGERTTPPPRFLASLRNDTGSSTSVSPQKRRPSRLGVTRRWSEFTGMQTRDPSRAADPDPSSTNR